jgi:hypothetical protein
MIRSFLSILLLIIAFSFVPKNGFGQCDVSVKLESIKHSAKNKKDGKISFQVKAKGAYECLLNMVSGERIITINKMNGSGEMVLDFENLEPQKYYEVLVIFTDESEFLCKKRVLSDIIIEETK